MRSEDDFDLQLFLPYLLNQAAEESSLAFQQIYKRRYGMLRTEWRVLFHLGIYGPLTAKRIGEMARIHKTKISRAVRALGDKRMIARQRSERDRRHEVLSLTPAGQAAYADLRQVAQDYDARLVRRLGATEARALRDVLKKLAHLCDGGT